MNYEAQCIGVEKHRGVEFTKHFYLLQSRARFQLKNLTLKSIELFVNYFYLQY